MTAMSTPSPHDEIVPEPKRFGGHPITGHLGAMRIVQPEGPYICPSCKRQRNIEGGSVQTTSGPSVPMCHECITAAVREAAPRMVRELREESKERKQMARQLKAIRRAEAAEAKMIESIEAAEVKMIEAAVAEAKMIEEAD